MDQVQECQALLIEIEELSKQKEEHIRRLAVCEGTVNERRRMVKVFSDRGTDSTAEKTVEMMQAKLDEHKDIVMRHVENIKKLQSAFRTVILGLLKNADPDWLQYCRKTLLTAFHVAKDVHVLIMQLSGDVVLPYKEKGRFKGYRRRQQRRNR